MPASISENEFDYLFIQLIKEGHLTGPIFQFKAYANISIIMTNNAHIFKQFRVTLQ